MKYGKINRLKEDIGTAFDVLMYGSPIYQHGVKAGQWGRAAANVAGTYAGLKTEEKALGGDPAGRIGRGFGRALARSKYRRGTFNQRESMSAVWRAALLEAWDWERDTTDPNWTANPAKGRMKQTGTAPTAAEEVARQEAYKKRMGDLYHTTRPSAGRKTLGRMASRSTPEGFSGVIGEILNPGFKKGARQQGMGIETAQNARAQVTKMRAEQNTRSLVDPAARAREEARLKRFEQQAGEGLKGKAFKSHTREIGKQQVERLAKAKERLEKIRGIASNRAKTMNNVVKPDPLYWGGAKKKGLGLMGAAAGIGVVRAIDKAARAVSSASSMGYRQLMGPLPPVESAGGKRGNLQEGSKTWETRRRLYGPPGRKHKHWKFDFNNPAHVKKALHLKSDSDIKKLMKSTAKIDKHIGLKTTKGVPIQYAYRSNNRKNLYAGKTIGMRQNIISQHRKLGLDLPEGFENLSFDKINEIFKKRERYGWYKRQYKKVPTLRKLMIGAGAMWRKAKKALGFNESEILEEATFVESAPPAPRVCVFMEGKVATPTECDCDECLSVTRRMREGKLEETAASSFGQMLRPTETPPPKLETGTPVQVSKKHMIAANSRWRRLRKQVSTV